MLPCWILGLKIRATPSGAPRNPCTPEQVLVYACPWLVCVRLRWGKRLEYSLALTLIFLSVAGAQITLHGQVCHSWQCSRHPAISSSIPLSITLSLVCVCDTLLHLKQVSRACPHKRILILFLPLLYLASSVVPLRTHPVVLLRRTGPPWMWAAVVLSYYAVLRGLLSGPINTLRWGPDTALRNSLLLVSYPKRAQGWD